MPAPGELVFARPRRVKPPRHLADLTPPQRREVVAGLDEKPYRAGSPMTRPSSPTYRRLPAARLPRRFFHGC
jgi:hypothetical protein